MQAGLPCCYVPKLGRQMLCSGDTVVSLDIELGLMSKFIAGLIALLLSDVHAAPSFAGLWFSCEGRTGEFRSLEVESSNGQYHGLLESSHNGGVYSSELSGAAHGGKLELRGCQAYRGTEEIPCRPIEVVLQIRDSTFYRIPKQQFKSSVAQCRSRQKGT